MEINKDNSFEDTVKIENDFGSSTTYNENIEIENVYESTTYREKVETENEDSLVVNNIIKINKENSLVEKSIEINDLDKEFEQQQQQEGNIKNILKKKSSLLDNEYIRAVNIKNKLYKPNDIKYRGPLSYRYLKLLGWICIAISQINIINYIYKESFKKNLMGSFFEFIINYISILPTSLFIISSFGRVLSGNSTYLDFFISNGLAYLGIGFGVSFVYLRYICSVIKRIDNAFYGILPSIMNNLVSKRVNINIFSDIFILGLFHFFINYTPKVYFQGKKLMIFRLFSLIPILFIIISNILIILTGTTNFILPFCIYPFISIKSPLLCLIFISSSLWIKYRKSIFLSLGSTEKEYKKFISTKRNSLSFSVFLSVIIVIYCIIEFVIMVVFIFYKNFIVKEEFVIYKETMKLFGLGQCFSLILAIPFILLYSYTKKHNSTTFDFAIPFIGIGLSIFIYIEGLYRVFIKYKDDIVFLINEENEMPTEGI